MRLRPGAALRSCGSTGALLAACVLASACARSDDTENALAAAQAIVAANAGNEPEDPCNIDENWHYDVLAQLSAAVEQSGESAIELINAGPGDWAALDADAYRKWRAAATPVWTQSSLRGLIAGSQWWPYRDTTEDWWIEFAADGVITRHSWTDDVRLGRWEVAGALVETVFDRGGSATLAPTASRYHFDDGEQWFHVLHIEAVGRAGEPPWEDPLVLGPPAGDCGEYNY